MSSGICLTELRSGQIHDLEEAFFLNLRVILAFLTKFLSFFLFHSSDYYKLSLCVTFTNTFDNLCKSWRIYAQWSLLYKIIKRKRDTLDLVIFYLSWYQSGFDKRLRRFFLEISPKVHTRFKLILVYLLKSCFFLFHPKNYYKLSLCVTFSNTFDNLCNSWRIYAQWRLFYKIIKRKRDTLDLVIFYLSWYQSDFDKRLRRSFLEISPKVHTRFKLILVYLLKSCFFLLHPRNYYKLSFCVTFSNTFDNLCKSWRA